MMLSIPAQSPAEFARLLLAHWDSPAPETAGVFDLWVALLDADPGKAWLSILAAADQARSTQHLHNLGAGFLEQLITDHASLTLPLITSALAHHPNLRTALTAVWLGSEDPARDDFLALLSSLCIPPDPAFYGPNGAA